MNNFAIDANYILVALYQTTNPKSCVDEIYKYMQISNIGFCNTEIHYMSQGSSFNAHVNFA